jgi:hypothetical protein
MFTPGAVEWAMARVMEDLEDAGVPQKPTVFE